MEIDGNLPPKFVSTVQIAEFGAAQSGICVNLDQTRLCNGWREADRCKVDANAHQFIPVCAFNVGPEERITVSRTGNACAHLSGRTSSAHVREHRALAIQALSISVAARS
jgi:hypothetical protein